MKRIVLVEDDEPIRDVFKLLFENDYQLAAYETGTPIINSEIDVPDLFVLDKNIPGINGLDVCRFIKSNEKFGAVPVIMLSASPDILILAKQAGADDVIVKPFSIKALQQKISTYLDAI